MIEENGSALGLILSDDYGYVEVEKLHANYVVVRMPTGRVLHLDRNDLRRWRQT